MEGGIAGAGEKVLPGHWYWRTGASVSGEGAVLLRARSFPAELARFGRNDDNGSTPSVTRTCSVHLQA